MFIIDQLAEKKIVEAIESGELEDLPGHGAPLSLDDDVLVPEDLRVGYRMLKNAGYLPPDLQLRKDIRSVESLLIHTRSRDERDNLSNHLRYLMLQLNLANPDAPLFSERFYLDKIAVDS